MALPRKGLRGAEKKADTTACTTNIPRRRRRGGMNYLKSTKKTKNIGIRWENPVGLSVSLDVKLQRTSGLIWTPIERNWKIEKYLVLNWNFATFLH